MTIKTHACITIACDICGYVYDEDEYTAHFDDLDEARKSVTPDGWLITADEKIYCCSEDDEHAAALAELMPPEPHIPMDGQTEIPAADSCPSALLPAGTAPAERCVVRDRHVVHRTAEGREWADTDD